jgi:hypothetical protein
LFGPDLIGIILPFTIHSIPDFLTLETKFNLGFQFKLKQEADSIHNGIYQKAVEAEIKTKYRILRNVLIVTKKETLS